MPEPKELSLNDLFDEAIQRGKLKNSFTKIDPPNPEGFLKKSVKSMTGGEEKPLMISGLTAPMPSGQKEQYLIFKEIDGMFDKYFLHIMNDKIHFSKGFYPCIELIYDQINHYDYRPLEDTRAYLMMRRDYKSVRRGVIGIERSRHDNGDMLLVSFVVSLKERADIALVVGLVPKSPGDFLKTPDDY